MIHLYRLLAGAGAISVLVLLKMLIPVSAAKLFLYGFLITLTLGACYVIGELVLTLFRGED